MLIHMGRSKVILNEQQSKIVDEAIHWFYYSSNQLFEIDGDAGTGKSVTIYAILRELDLDEDEYLAMAYTGQAAAVMRSKGFFTARSIHSSLYEVVTEAAPADSFTARFFGREIKKKRFRKKRRINDNIKLLFIDEAYMVPQRMVKDIMSFGVKVIVCGDSKQLPPVNDNPGFLTGFGVHHLTQLMRQSERSPIIYLAKRASEGKYIHSGSYGNDLLVINDDELIPQMVGFADCICCGTNHTRDILNSWVRHIANLDISPYPFPSERLICRNNNWKIENDGIALANGLCGTIQGNIDPTTMTKNKFYINFLPDLLRSPFVDLAVDTKYFLGNFEYRDTVRRLDTKAHTSGELFEFAYALTTHLCQGSEYERGIYIEEFMRPQMNNQLNYTGITRFKKQLIYVKKKRREIFVPSDVNI